VVVPAFNEEAVIEEAHRRLAAACRQAVGEDFEIVYVDDGSRDRTWGLLGELAEIDRCVVAASLSRNFGHQQALTAGLSLARGELVLCIDADLQDPPELLSAMIALIEQGNDVVYGQRESRAGESAFKLGTAAAFYRLLRRLTDVDIPADTGDFRLMRREVVDALLAMPEQHRFVRGLVAWLGYRQVPLRYARQERFAGETKYPLRKMLRLASDAITGFSTLPLRIATWLAMGCFVLAAGVGSYAVLQWMLGNTLPGWTSVVVVVAFLSSVQLLCLGILGEYIGRLFMESKQRPLAIVREVRVRADPSVTPASSVPVVDAKG
jgi:dolichol-phosphate mannosyltransferase